MSFMKTDRTCLDCGHEITDEDREKMKFEGAALAVRHMKGDCPTEITENKSRSTGGVTFEVLNDPNTSHRLVRDDRPRMISDALKGIGAVIDAFDDNPRRDGLKNTPARYVKFLTEFLRPERFEFTSFEDDGYDQMIVEDNISFFSLCEHHVLPFFGTATVAYIPKKGKIVGLSKLARCVEWYSRRLQTQERITNQVAQAVNDALQPRGVGVVIKAQHLCMSMRGVKKPGAVTTTSAVHGVLLDDSSARAEFLQLIRG